jgi:hypothetical protein
MKSAKTILAMVSLVMWMMISMACRKENAFTPTNHHNDQADSTHEVLQGWSIGGPLLNQLDTVK